MTSSSVLFSDPFFSAMRDRPPLTPRFRKWCLFVRTPSHPDSFQCQVVCEGQECHVIVGDGKVECAEPVVGPLVVQWLDHAVDRGFVKTCSLLLQHREIMDYTVKTSRGKW